MKICDLYAATFQTDLALHSKLLRTRSTDCLYVSWNVYNLYTDKRQRWLHSNTACKREDYEKSRGFPGLSSSVCSSKSRGFPGLLLLRERQQQQLEVGNSQVLKSSSRVGDSQVSGSHSIRCADASAATARVGDSQVS